jgi:UDP-N-acetylmuramoylalanine--D-glutamate ligase
VDTKTIVEVLTNFKGVKHRIQTIAEEDGVTYIDDSKATNSDATIKAVEAMKKDTVLLLGGKSLKNIVGRFLFLGSIGARFGYLSGHRYFTFCVKSL